MQQKQHFRIFKLVEMNRVDCKSRGAGNEETSREMILAIEMENKGSLNCGTDSKLMKYCHREGHQPALRVYRRLKEEAGSSGR